MKKVLSVLLAVCLLLGALPVAASAAGDLEVSIAESGYDPGRLIIHNVQSQQTAKLYGENIPMYDVTAGELFTKYFDYPESVLSHNCGNCGYVVSLCEAKLVNGELRSAKDPTEAAEPLLEAETLVWHSPEAASTAESWGPGQVTEDHYTYSAATVGKIYCVLVQYEDDSKGHLGDTTSFAIRVTKPTVGGFNDVHEGDYYANAVAWAMEKGVTSGAAKDRFGVGSPCKREQIATFLWRANGSPATSKTATFSDMTNNTVFNKAISWAVERGITSGAGNNRFGVGATCTRVQAVTFLWIAAGRPAPQKQAAFSDMTNNSVFNNAISWAVEQGITGGTGNNKFSPNKPCTREQIVTFLYKAYK